MIMHDIDFDDGFWNWSRIHIGCSVVALLLLRRRFSRVR
jgi:hypothetical protein